MFEFVRKHTKIIQFVLLLLIFPSFVFFGVQGFSDLSKDDGGLAEVDGHPITRPEFENAMRLQQDRVRAQRPNVDAAMLETPEFRQQVFEGLMQERVLAASVDKLRLYTPDSRLQRLFAADPQAAAIRNPDGSLNKEFLAARGINSAAFAEQMRRDYSARQVLAGIAAGPMASKSASDLALDALLQRREVQIAKFETKAYVAQAQPSAQDLEKFYAEPAQAKRFEAPEQARIEYLVLDTTALAAQQTVSEADVRKFYDENAARFTQPEERRASHILVKADAGMSADQRKAARAKAEALLAEVRKAPDTFAAVARKNSDDPVSAAQGGDLDFFNRDAMTKPFADAVFSMKKGQISDLVQSEFGFHIILLTDVRGGTRQPFEAVREGIEKQLRDEQAKRAYAQAAEQFTNTVYEQSDSLKPAADLLKLKIQSAQVTRPPQANGAPEWSNPKLLKAIFDATNIKQKRNTDAIEVAPGRLISAHVVEYLPARRRPLADVQAQVRELWVQQRADQLAKQAAEQQLQAWKKDASAAKLGAAQTVSRNAPLPDAPFATGGIMQVPTDKLPTWTVVDLGSGQGHAVVRINRVLPADVPAQERQVSVDQYARLWASAEVRAYYDGLKSMVKAKPSAAASAVLAASEPASASAP